MRQCKFIDNENIIHGGIIDDSGNIICGCCGGIFTKDEIGDGEDCIVRIIKIYDRWTNLDEEIMH